MSDKVDILEKKLYNLERKLIRMESVSYKILERRLYKAERELAELEQDVADNNLSIAAFAAVSHKSRRLAYAEYKNDKKMDFNGLNTPIKTI